ncbi:MAG: hypothetical protein Q7V17_13900 [Afipia sp.]|nr:hypothetical protein [Afipia sp.]
MTSERQNRISIPRRIFHFLFKKEPPLHPLSMDITAPNYTSGSGIDRQSQNVAPAATFTGDDPITSPHVGMSDARNSVSLGYSNCFRTAYAMRSSIDAHTIAVDGDALRSGAGNQPWRQFCKEHGGGHKDKR